MPSYTSFCNMDDVRHSAHPASLPDLFARVMLPNAGHDVTDSNTSQFETLAQPFPARFFCTPTIWTLLALNHLLITATHLKP